MVVRHNLEAFNAMRQLGINRKDKADSMEKLSSGYRINRAADDAAGLAISEKMRRVIRGLRKGIENTEEGVSLCQVADGALVEVNDMLQRISELSVKSANGTNTDDDRAYIQLEVSALIKEIDRISETTTFNEIILFDGMDPLGGGTIDNSKPSTNGPFFQLFGNDISKTGYMQEALTKDMVDDSTSTLDTPSPSTNPYVSVHIDIPKINDLKDLVGTTFFVNCCTKCCPSTVVFTDGVGVKTTKGKIEIGMMKADGTYLDDKNTFAKYVVDSIKGKDPSHVKFAYKGPKLYIYDVDNNAWTQDEKEAAYFCDSEKIWGNADEAGKKLWIHSGNEAGDGIWLVIGNISSKALGIMGLDVSTIKGAENSIAASKEAIKKVMLNRSRIGAQQNRLEHTIANEGNIVENTAAAESRIRDTDIAKEMVRFSIINILEQAGVSVLAQANQSKQGILSLLQG